MVYNNLLFLAPAHLSSIYVTVFVLGCSGHHHCSFQTHSSLCNIRKSTGNVCTCVYISGCMVFSGADMYMNKILCYNATHDPYSHRVAGICVSVHAGQVAMHYHCSVE